MVSSRTSMAGAGQSCTSSRKDSSPPMWHRFGGRPLILQLIDFSCWASVRGGCEQGTASLVRETDGGACIPFMWFSFPSCVVAVFLGVWPSHSRCLVVIGDRKSGEARSFPLGEAPNKRLGDGNERSLLSKKTDGENGGLLIGDEFGGGDCGVLDSVPPGDF